MNKQREYNKLKDEMLNCSRCDLGCNDSVEGYNQHVMGQGNLNADMFVLAEAPGLQETIHSQPLTSTGVSGKMYEKVLKVLGLNREDVYTANTVLCRPPKNRNPEDWEVLKCKPFLERQLKLIEPKLVVTFGRFAAQVMLGNFKITREHGQLRESKQFGVKVFPLYHPAYVKAYAHNKMEEFKTDVKNLKKILNELE